MLGFSAEAEELAAKYVEFGVENRHADLFIALVRQNGGFLSKKKRKLPEFELLTDTEIEQMEKAIRETLGISGSAQSPADD